MLYVLSVLGPLLSALVVTATHSRKEGVRPLFAKALRWRFSPAVYLMALFTVAGLKLLSTSIHAALGGKGPEAWVTGSAGSILLVLVSQFGYVMFAEEVGWREFALPCVHPGDA